MGVRAILPSHSVPVLSHRHMLVVFGGLQGLEAGVDADPNLEVTDPSVLFDFYLNTCPSQGSRTIRTEVRQGLMTWELQCLCAQNISVSGRVTQPTTMLFPTAMPQPRAAGLPSRQLRAAVLTAPWSVSGSIADLSVGTETSH